MPKDNRKVSGGKSHWEKIYTKLPMEKMGWYEPHLKTSLEFILSSGIKKDEPIIDVGGGASTLIDDLHEEGFFNVTILDISSPALEISKRRLDKRAIGVKWITGDITEIILPEDSFLLWHDRAVFHFLTDSGRKMKYLQKLQKSLQPGGHLIMGVFSREAPDKCSGLPVRRYSVEELQNTLGKEFHLVKHKQELHITPGGVHQTYLYTHFVHSP